MPLQSRKYRTQWTSTFFAAGELTRRGYLVTITHGNARFADLLVQSPNGKSFSIDVKGMSTRNWIPIKKPDREMENQYYILVYTLLNLKDGETPRLGKFKPWASNGIPFKQAENYQDKWTNLPGYEELKEQNP